MFVQRGLEQKPRVVVLGLWSQSTYSRGFSFLPYKVYGAESAFLILISDLYDPVGPPLDFQELLQSAAQQVNYFPVVSRPLMEWSGSIRVPTCCVQVCCK